MSIITTIPCHIRTNYDKVLSPERKHVHHKVMLDQIRPCVRNIPRKLSKIFEEFMTFYFDVSPTYDNFIYFTLNETSHGN